MFSNLRQGSQLHILHKTSTPYIELGTIEFAPNNPMLGYYPNPLPIDITVRVGEKVATYQQIPSNAECAEVTEKTTGEKVFISSSKDALNTEIHSMMQKSIEAVNSVEYHKQRIKTCETLLAQLNPEIVEKQQQAQEINELKALVTSMREQIALLQGEKTSKKKEQ